MIALAWPLVALVVAVLGFIAFRDWMAKRHAMDTLRDEFRLLRDSVAMVEKRLGEMEFKVS